MSQKLQHLCLCTVSQKPVQRLRTVTKRYITGNPGKGRCSSIFIEGEKILRRSNDEALEVVCLRHGEDDGVVLRLGPTLDYRNGSTSIIGSLG